MAEGTTSDDELHRLDRVISRLLSSPRPIWSDSTDSTRFLAAVDDLLALLAGRGSPRGGVVGRADVVLYKSMQRLAHEFEVLMGHGTAPLASPAAVPFSGQLVKLGPHSDDEVEEEEDDDEEEEIRGRFSGPDADDRIPVARPVTDYNYIIDALPWGTISDLREIAKRMLAAGSAEDCVRAYCASRRRFLRESVSRLGLWCIRSSTEEEQDEEADDQALRDPSPWEEIQADAQRWVPALKVAVLVLYPSERRLCDRVFNDLPGPSDVASAAFADSCRGSALRLLGFADAVCAAAGRGDAPPTRLYRILDMYDTIRDLIPEIRAVFPGPYGAPVRQRARGTLRKLGGAIRDVFKELYNLVLRDKVDGPPFPPDAGVHPLTRYVVNFLRTALESWRTLLGAMEEEGGVDPSASTGHLEGADDPHFQLGPSSSNLYAQVSWIMEQLQRNLEVRASLYREHTPRFLFQMNNTMYMIRRASGTELEQLLGDEWVGWRTSKVRELQGRYLSKTWGQVLRLLSPKGDGLAGQRPTSAAKDGTGSSAEERLQTFCAHLDELCDRHRRWVVPDERLRAELRTSVADSVVPAYRQLLALVNRNSKSTTRQMQSGSIWYSSEAVNDLIRRAFDPNFL